MEAKHKEAVNGKVTKAGSNDVYNEVNHDFNDDDFSVVVDDDDGEGKESGDSDQEDDCLRDNLDNCCGENVRGVRDCACCLKQGTCEVYKGCRRIDYKRWGKSAFNRESVKNKFPILKWLPKYRLNHFLGDVIAGFTVGLTVIPQSLAFAKIALLPPEYGMYTAMVCVFVYIVFGTAKDVNLGPAAVLSLLVSKFAQSPIEGDATYAIVLSMMTGIVQFLLGAFHLGFIVNYVSHPVLESFTTAAVITIAFGQVRNWLGLEGVPNEFLDQVYWTFKKIPETNIWDFVLGLICMIVLILLKKMKTTSCMKKKSVSIPVRVAKYLIWLISTAKNAFVVMLAIVTAYLFYINGSEPFTLTGPIPSGLPPFKPPSFSVSDGNSTTTYDANDIFQKLGMGIILVPLISFIETMAIAKNFGRKNNYKVDKDQELIASGIANLLGSFTSAYPVTGTFSGSAVNFQSGVKTTGAGLYAGALVMLALLFLTPVFYYIPSATLAAVIIVAVLDLADFAIVIHMWNVKKIDLVPWLVTFVLGLCLGIENGIILGIVVSLCILIFPASRPKVRTEYKGSRFSISSGSQQSYEADDYAVLVIEQGLMFPSVEYFVDHIMDAVMQGGSSAFRSVILDFVHISSVDFSLVQGLEQLSEDFALMKVKMFLVRVRHPVQRVLKKAGLKGYTCAVDVDEAIEMIKKLEEEEEEGEGKPEIFVVSSDFIGDENKAIVNDQHSINNYASFRNKTFSDPNNVTNNTGPFNACDADDNDRDSTGAGREGVDNLSYHL